MFIYICVGVRVGVYVCVYVCIHMCKCVCLCVKSKGREKRTTPYLSARVPSSQGVKR